jgi:hypothetical protein
MLAGTEFRHRVRQALDTRSAAAVADLEAMLGAFAPEPVRGDYVPTIAESYEQVLAIVNARHSQPEQMPLPLPEPVTVQTVINGRRVKITIQPE